MVFSPFTVCFGEHTLRPGGREGAVRVWSRPGPLSKSNGRDKSAPPHQASHARTLARWWECHSARRTRPSAHAHIIEGYRRNLLIVAPPVVFNGYWERAIKMGKSR